MRNLKRVLSLVLAVMMVIGMMVISTSAANTSYADDDQITHPQAVNLLKALGVMSGNPNGTFSPKGILQREQMAKMAYVVANMDTDDYTIYEGGSSLTDISTTWAEGYIVWCALPENQFITGNPNGTFSPKGTLTVGQACAILLRVLGYDNTLEGLTGGSYAINALSLATRIGLTAGCTGLKANDYISRDDAAQLTYNALFQNKVTKTYTTGLVDGQVVRYVNGYSNTFANGKPTSGSTWAADKFNAKGLSAKKTGTVDGIDATTGAAKSGATVIKGLAFTPELVGMNIEYYNMDGSCVSSHVTSTVVATIDGAEYSAKVGATEADKKAFTLDGATYYSNGSTAVDASDAVAGAIVELINNDNDAKIEVVRITKKTMAVVGNAGVTVSTDGKKVTVAGVVDTATDVNKVKGYEGLAANDVVMKVTIGGTTYIEKVEPVVDTLVSITNGTTYNMKSGDKYVTSGVGSATFGSMTIQNAGKELKIYCDNYGHVINATLATAAPAPAVAQYAVMLKWARIQDTDPFAPAPATYQAKLLFPDGDIKIVDVAAYHSTQAGAALVDDGQANSSSNMGDAINNAITAEGAPVTYTVDSDGLYTIKLVDEGATVNTKTVNLGAFDGTNGKYSIFEGKKPVFAPIAVSAPSTETSDTTVGGSKGAIKGNNDTVFFFKKVDADTSAVSYTRVVGINNLSDFTTVNDNSKGIKGYALIVDGFASIVVVTNGVADDASDTADHVYFLNTGFTTYPGATANDPGYKEYAAVVDGEATTVKTTTSCVVPAAGMYDVSLTNGLVSAVTPVATQQGVEYAGGLVKVGASDLYTCEKATVYVIDPSSSTDKVTTIAPSEITKSATDLVIIDTVSSNSTAIETLYIIKNTTVQASLPAYSSGTVTVDTVAYASSNINDGLTAVVSGSRITLSGTLAKYGGSACSALETLWGGDAPAGHYIALEFTAPAGAGIAADAPVKVEWTSVQTGTGTTVAPATGTNDDVSHTANTASVILLVGKPEAGNTKTITIKVTWKTGVAATYTVDMSGVTWAD